MYCRLWSHHRDCGVYLDLSGLKEAWIRIWWRGNRRGTFCSHLLLVKFTWARHSAAVAPIGIFCTVHNNQNISCGLGIGMTILVKSWSNINVLGSLPNAGASCGHPYQGPAVVVPRISMLLATSWLGWGGGLVEFGLLSWSPSLAVEFSFDLSLTLRPFHPVSVKVPCPSGDSTHDGSAVRFD